MFNRVINFALFVLDVASFDEIACMLNVLDECFRRLAEVTFPPLDLAF